MNSVRHLGRWNSWQVAPWLLISLSIGVGAYESNGQAQNPGWTIKPAFKLYKSR